MILSLSSNEDNEIRTEEVGETGDGLRSLNTTPSSTTDRSQCEDSVRLSESDLAEIKRKYSTTSTVFLAHTISSPNIQEIFLW